MRPEPVPLRIRMEQIGHQLLPHLARPVARSASWRVPTGQPAGVAIRQEDIAAVEKTKAVGEILCEPANGGV